MTTEALKDTVLENEWHPVCIAAKLRDEPVSVTILGERAAVFRAASGGVYALRDLCVHRGAMLSKGRVEGDNLVCPYHGWKYDGSGACVCIPAQRKTDTIPQRARKRSTVAWRNTASSGYASESLRAVCRIWRNSSIPLPAARLRTLHGPCRRDAGHRELHRFCPSDVRARRPARPPGLCRSTGLQSIQREGPHLYERRAHIPAGRPFRLRSGGRHDVRLREGVFRPLAGRLSKRDAATGQTLWILLTVLPVTEKECNVYMAVSRNYGFDVPDEQFIQFQDTVFEQDAWIIETQKPELLPLDLQQELNHKADVLSVAYRRWLIELGVKIGTA